MRKTARAFKTQRRNDLDNFWAHTQDTAKRMRMTPARLAHWILYMTFRQEARINAEEMEKSKDLKEMAYAHTTKDEFTDYYDPHEAFAMIEAIMEIGEEYDPDYDRPVLPKERK